MSAADRKPVSNTRRIVAMQFCQHATQEFHGEYCDKCLHLADAILAALDAAGYEIRPKRSPVERERDELIEKWRIKSDARVKAAKETP